MLLYSKDEFHPLPKAEGAELFLLLEFPPLLDKQGAELFFYTATFLSVITTSSGAYFFVGNAVSYKEKRHVLLGTSQQFIQFITESYLVVFAPVHNTIHYIIEAT